MKAIMLAAPQPPPYPVEAELYFLPAGHFLFRANTGNGVQSKFVTIQDVSAAFTGAELDTGWLPPGLVRAGYCKHGAYAVYAVPPQVVSIALAQDGTNDLQTLTLPIPSTLMVGIETAYYLAALAGAEFSPEAALFHPPFPNVHADGKICWGGNAPKRAKPDYMPEAWRLFFGTPFNNHLVEGKSREHNADIRLRLLALAEGKPRARYPLKDLVGRNKSAKAWVKELLGGGRDDD